MNEYLYWYWLCNIKGVGLKKRKALLSCFESPENIWDLKAKDLQHISLLNTIDIKNIQESRQVEVIKEGYQALEERQIRFIHLNDPAYPERLKHLYDPPTGLYIKGELPNNRPSLAIIGSRKCTTYGKEMARYYGRELAKAGIQIISGLARGIDTAAHQGVLEAKGETFAILGNGLNICYPKENYKLYRDIEITGGVLSEYNLYTQPKAGHFPMRNRLISGLSDAIFIIEAAQKSGSLITAEIGLEQGKDIFALPGRTIDPLSEGTNGLIKIGAKMITQVEDILEELEVRQPIIPSKTEKTNEKIANILDNSEKIVYACLSLEPKYIDDIVNETQMKSQEVLHILFSLELKGIIKQLPNKHFIINV